jgi:hypothetical protein
MAKKNFKQGIDNVFRSTVKELEELEKIEVSKEVKEEPAPEKKRSKKPETEAMAFYNLKYPKTLQKEIKRFCIEYDGFDMKDVFTKGAILFMEQHRDQHGKF